MKWLRYLNRCFAVAAFLSNWLPKAVSDGRITVPEMVEFIQEILKIFDWSDVSIELPDVYAGEAKIKARMLNWNVKIPDDSKQNRAFEVNPTKPF